MLINRLIISRKKLEDFCTRWQVEQLSVFGSAVRDDFSEQSDVDLLVAFTETSDWGLFEHLQMKQELKELFDRNVDLITRRSLEQSRNILLRDEILNSARVLYSADEKAHV